MQRLIAILVLLAAGPARAEKLYLEPSLAAGGLARVDHVMSAGRVALGFDGPYDGWAIRGGGYAQMDNVVRGGFSIGGELESALRVGPATLVGLRLGAGNAVADPNLPWLFSLGPRVRYGNAISAGLDVIVLSRGPHLDDGVPRPTGGRMAVGGLASVRGEGKGGLVVGGAAMAFAAILAVGFAATDRS